MSIHLQTVKIEGVDYLQISQIEIHHAVNDYARATVRLVVDEKKAQKFLEQSDTDQIKISAKDNKKDVVLFVGFITNLSLEVSLGRNKLTLELCDSSYLLDLKRVHCSFQKLDAKYEEILKTEVADAKGKIQLKVTDKAIEKLILQLNETTWQFIKRKCFHGFDCPRVARDNRSARRKRFR